jgi:hypothetical protein
MAKEKGIRHWNYNIEKSINDKREGFKKFLSTVKEDKSDYSHKRVLSERQVRKNHRNTWQTFASYLERDVTRLQPQAYKILKKM